MPVTRLIARPAPEGLPPTVDPKLEPTRAKVMNDFVAWAGKNPAYMKESPTDGLFRYLAETYPCKK